VTRTDLAQAARKADRTRLQELEAIRDERLELMRRLARLPKDIIFYTQITMEASEDHEFSSDARSAHQGALIGVEAITPEGLKDVYKASTPPATRSSPGCGPSAPTTSTCWARSSSAAERSAADLPGDGGARRQGRHHLRSVRDADPVPRTVDFEKWAKGPEAAGKHVDGIPYARHWLIPRNRRPHIYTHHPVMSPEEIARTPSRRGPVLQLRSVWRRSKCVRSLKARLAFIMISKLYRQMYANTGITTDSGRHARSVQWSDGWPRRSSGCSPPPRCRISPCRKRVAEPAA